MNLDDYLIGYFLEAHMTALINNDFTGLDYDYPDEAEQVREFMRHNSILTTVDPDDEGEFYRDDILGVWGTCYQVYYKPLD